MKRTISDLLDEYRAADFNKRLHLYLQYPELRSEFTEMDRLDLRQKTQGCTRRTKCITKVPLGTHFGLRPGCVRRLFGMT